MEFAFVLVLLVTLVIGIAETSSAWRVRSVLRQAAREGARAAAVKADLSWQDPEIHTLVSQMVEQSGIPSGDLTTAVTFEVLDPARTSLISGDPVTVTLAYTYTPAVMAFVPGLNAMQFNMHSTMAYQWRASDGSGGSGGPIEPPPPGALPGPADGTDPGGGRDSDPWAFHPMDPRGQGNMGRPCMRPPHGFDPNRPIDETGNQGRPHEGCIE